jgi:3'(2'), 5'-bisphosphate nucleotidase
MSPAEQTGPSRTLHPDDALIEALAGIAFEAAREALGLRGRNVRRRGDEADAAGRTPEERARAVILDALSEIAPRTPIVAPEAAPHRPIGDDEEVFVAAPLDGAEGGDPDAPPRGDFTINIALVRAGEPAIGVVFAPGIGRLWAGRPGSAWRAEARPDRGVGPSRPIRVRPTPVGGVTAVTMMRGRTSDMNALLQAYPITDIRTAASAVRFCLIADGTADIHPDLGRSMAWSTAAGDAILRAAGGRTLTLDGEPLRYDLAAPFANPQIVAVGSVGLRAPAVV